MTGLVRTSERKLRIRAEESHIVQVREFITEISSSLGFDAKEINSIKLAVDEGCTNIIRHAYRGVESGFIDILAVVNPTSVSFVLIDQGKSFDFNRASDPNLQTYMKIGKKGGLGIFLMKKLMDEVEYHVTNRGNELWLTKSRPHQRTRVSKVVPVRFSLKWRATLAATLIFSAVLVSFTWKIYKSQEEDTRGQILQQSLDVAQTLSKNAWNHIMSGNDLALASLIRNAVPGNTLVKEIAIVNSKNVIYGHSDPYMIFKEYAPPPKQTPFVTRKEYTITTFRLPTGDEIYQVTAPVYVEGRADAGAVIGSTILRISGDGIFREVQDARQSALLYAGLILILGNVGLLFLVHVLMMPFKKLASWVRGMGEGTLEDSIIIDSDQDLGEIAEAFNDMARKFRFAQSELVEKERLQQEIEVAREIQHMLLPRSFPKVEGYEIASFYRAAKEVGGDYFDFVWVDEDTLGIAIADVSGKGVPGSLVMTMIRTALRLEARGNKSASDVLVKVNKFVSDDIKKGMFITMFYIILDSKNRIVNFASAGHNPVILYRSATKKSYYLNPEGFPVGISIDDEDLFARSIRTDSMRLIKGDFLVAYTDGVTEAMNPEREQYGEERFLDAIRRYGGNPVGEFVKSVQDEIDTFTQDHPQNDDITLLVIQDQLSREEYHADLGKKAHEMIETQGVHVKEACRTVGISTTAYYKWKKRHEDGNGDTTGEEMPLEDISQHHMCIEDQAKVLNIVREHPEYGVRRITVELATDKYQNTTLPEHLVYRELKRLKLNTLKQRQAFIEKSERGSKRMKPPGTPLVTIDGRTITEGLIPLPPSKTLPLPKPSVVTDPELQKLGGHPALPAVTGSVKPRMTRSLPPPSPLWPGMKRGPEGDTPAETGAGAALTIEKKDAGPGFLRISHPMVRTIPLIYRDGEELDAFVEKEVTRTLEMGKKLIIFDLAQVDRARVFSWTSVTKHLRRMREQGGDICIMNMSEEFESIFRQLALDRIIKKVKGEREIIEYAETLTAARKQEAE
jgi:serine phosphatase RsbU (regulator of sigma subunit)/anti-sigma regulatory factor (Ser/Thr protein kinase)/anti-anti-sigma regulatory factor